MIVDKTITGKLIITTSRSKFNGQVLNTPDSYTDGCGFKYSLEIGYADRCILWFPSIPPG
jgi:hypothetical protein